MQEFEIVPGADLILHVFIEDTRTDDGSGLTGLLFNSSGLTAYYIKRGDSGETAITLATTSLGSHTDGGFLEVDSANMPGWYELQLPDACIAPRFGHCMITLRGAANMAVTNVRLIEEQRRQFCRYDPRVHSGTS